MTIQEQVNDLLLIFTGRDIASRTGVHESTISRIKDGITSEEEVKFHTARNISELHRVSKRKINRKRGGL